MARITAQKPLMISPQAHKKLKEMGLLTSHSMRRLVDLFLERYGSDLLAELIVEASNAKLRRQGLPPLQPKWKPPPPHRRYTSERAITKFAKGKPLGILPERQRDDPAELG